MLISIPHSKKRNKMGLKVSFILNTSFFPDVGSSLDTDLSGRNCFTSEQKTRAFISSLHNEVPFRSAYERLTSAAYESRNNREDEWHKRGMIDFRIKHKEPKICLC
ncbi:hypothetical protein AVEN_73793-1 [Araneus ventricosus]|uniref:Uncharacterized protein n=1 Tax=Araneus ventricosus TaxID=182803 RepID=A0A4Y2HDZ5_ARAVE|nr:hypothetical protein AVEN_73793-1 [Araneus ventricosus]